MDADSIDCAPSTSSANPSTSGAAPSREPEGLAVEELLQRLVFGGLEREPGELRAGGAELLAHATVVVEERGIVEDELLAHDALERGRLLEQEAAGACRLRRGEHLLAALRGQAVDREQKLGERVQERQAHQQERQQNELEERARVIHGETPAAIIRAIMTPP
ncbi:MAG TPA: hypothetical protein VNF72_03770 [Myxococcota bacterium]|nr:hypothetical protein [Myxococcota bacterium]